jgi:fluoride exporter
VVWVLIAAGGVVGALLRLGIDTVFAFSPIATLLVNLLGSFAIGALLPWLLRDVRRSHLIPFVITGVLGGFTTFSAFAADTVLLLDDGMVIAAGGYVVVTLAGGILAARLGQRMAGQP